MPFRQELPYLPHGIVRGQIALKVLNRRNKRLGRENANQPRLIPPRKDVKRKTFHGQFQYQNPWRKTSH